MIREPFTPEKVMEFGAFWLEAQVAQLSVEERLKGLKPKEVLSQYTPQQRLKGLKPKERLKGLKPQEILDHLTNISADKLKAPSCQI